MGWTWEVEAFVLDSHGYGWNTVWTGESFIKALRALRYAKRNAGSVRLTWR